MGYHREMAKRRRPSRLPVGPALVGPVLVGALVLTGCPERKHDPGAPLVIPPQTNELPPTPPQPVPPELPPQPPPLEGSGQELAPPPTTPKQKPKRKPDQLGALRAGPAVAIIGPFDRAKK
jgi:hypothetical protein